MPTKANIQSAILAITPQGGHAAIKQVLSSMSKEQMALMLESMQQEEGIAKTQAGAQAAAQAAATVAQQGGSKRQVKAAAQAAAQATEAAMGGKRKASSTRKSRTRPKSNRKSSTTNRSMAKSSAKSKPAVFRKSKGGGWSRDPSIAKNKTVLVQGLIKLGRKESKAELMKKTRDQLEVMVRHQYKKGKSVRGGGGSAKNLPKTFRGDYARIRKLLREGAIPHVSKGTRRRTAGVTPQSYQGVMDMQRSDPKERYMMFFEVYKPVLKEAGYLVGPGSMGKLPKKSKSRKKSGRKSIQARYQAIKQQGGAKKFPYYLAKGYVRRIGGGPGGPGVVRVVPGTGAVPFNRLDEDEKRKVLNYLNTSNGKSLRGKGAKRKVDVQGIINLKANEKAAKQQARKRAKAAAQKRKAAKGSSNQWWK